MNVFTLRKLLYSFSLLIIFLLPVAFTKAQCFNYALKYNRPQQQYATLPDNIAQSLTSDFTIEMWIYPTSSLSFLQSESLFTAGNSTSDFMTLALFSGNNSPVFSLDVNGTEDDIITGAKVTINTWHHIAVVSSGGTATLYLDGHSIGSTTLSNTPSALGGGAGTTDDWLGRSEFAGEQYYAGYMDEFRISDDARYTSNFTPPNSPFTPDGNTDVLYHFDDASGQIVSDASGNGNNGVLGSDNSVESVDPTWQNCSTLPIFLTQFTAVLQNNVVDLEWTAYKDFNPGSFEVQRGTDGINFATIGTVEADNSSGTFNYQFTDPTPNKGNNFYRLLIIDLGSDNKYSGVLYVANNNNVVQFSVFPTITNSSLVIQLAAPATLAIIDAAGSTIKQFHLVQSQSINVSAYAKGFYFIVNKETGQVARFIKN